MADFKITTPHTDLSDTDDTYHQWYWPGAWGREPGIVMRDRAGRRPGKRQGIFLRHWLVLHCNNTGCGGRAVLQVAAMTHLADLRDPMVPG